MIVKEWTLLVLIGLLMNTADSYVSKYDWLVEPEEKLDRKNEGEVPKSGEDEVVIMENDQEAAKSMDPSGSSFDSLSDDTKTDASSQPKGEEDEEEEDYDEDCDENCNEFDSPYKDWIVGPRVIIWILIFAGPSIIMPVACLLDRKFGNRIEYGQKEKAVLDNMC
ncbi:hypothetical protein CAEBREN_17796 [Caenorhabditis brenneri]|uniref:Uncharacterized protein n=1 Tax=Caenorhabditis brenneri TaxID=135651 RepID=G0MJU2_CAEBE|nr:hypothetical protein CAEBREN_17796 [Caenorhabditis brenneri]